MARSRSDHPTPQQRRVLALIVEQTAERGYPPTMEEIATRLGLASRSTVRHHLCRLEALGLIRRDPHRARGMVVVEQAAPALVAVG